MVIAPMLPQPVKAAGLTEFELRKKIVEAYEQAKLIANARVAVSVTEARGASFSVLGQVGKVGIYPLQGPGMRLVEALSLAGGLKGEVEKIYVVRKDGRILEIPAGPLMHAQMQWNVVIGAGDNVLRRKKGM